MRSTNLDGMIQEAARKAEEERKAEEKNAADGKEGSKEQCDSGTAGDTFNPNNGSSGGSGAATVRSGNGKCYCRPCIWMYRTPLMCRERQDRTLLTARDL